MHGISSRCYWLLKTVRQEIRKTLRLLRLPRLLKIIIPYIVIVVGAVVIFVAGAFAAFWFTGRVITPRFGMQQAAELAQDHALLDSLDAGNVDQARSLLIMREDFNLMSLDMLAPYMSDDLSAGSSACAEQNMNGAWSRFRQAERA